RFRGDFSGMAVPPPDAAPTPSSFTLTIVGAIIVLLRACGRWSNQSCRSSEVTRSAPISTWRGKERGTLPRLWVQAADAPARCVRGIAAKELRPPGRGFINVDGVDATRPPPFLPVPPISGADVRCRQASLCGFPPGRPAGRALAAAPDSRPVGRW